MSDRYINKTYVGSGAMATVYRAWDTVMERNVALKEVAQELRGQKEISNLMLNEAQKIARIKHPNVVQIYDVLYDNDIPTIVQEYVGGGSLASSVGAGFCSVDVALKVLQDLFGGLSAIHAAGMIHRDIKPDNLLNDNGLWKLVDFGVAMTGEEEVIPFVGSKYAAPEILLAPNEISARCDFYSAGVMAMELLLGSERFEQVARDATSRVTGSPGADNPSVFWQKWAYSKIEWPALNTIDTRFSEPLSIMISHLVALDQNDRPKTCEEVLARLRELREHEANLMAAPTVFQGNAKKDDREGEGATPAKKKQPLWFKLLVGIFGFLLLAVGGLLLMPKPKRAPAPEPVLIASTAQLIEAMSSRWVSLPQVETAIPGVVVAETAATLDVGMSITLDLTSPEAGYLTVLHLTSDNVLTVIYPSPTGETEQLASGVTDTVAEELSLQAAEPLGTDFFVTLVTPEPLALQSAAPFIAVEDWGRALILSQDAAVSDQFAQSLLSQPVTAWAAYGVEMVDPDAVQPITEASDDLAEELIDADAVQE